MRVLSGLLIPVFATMRGSFNTGAAANLNKTHARRGNPRPASIVADARIDPFWVLA